MLYRLYALLSLVVASEWVLGSCAQDLPTVLVGTLGIGLGLVLGLLTFVWGPAPDEELPAVCG